MGGGNDQTLFVDSLFEFLVSGVVSYLVTGEKFLLLDNGGNVQLTADVLVVRLKTWIDK